MSFLTSSRLLHVPLGKTLHIIWHYPGLYDHNQGIQNWVVSTESKFLALKKRKNTQKATIAIARKLAIAIYMIINNGKRFEELTADYVPLEAQARDLRNIQRLARKMGKEASFAIIEQLFG